LIFAFARDRRCFIASSETKNARAICSVVSPPGARSVRPETQRGMAAGEDQLKPLVLDHRVVSSSIVASGTASRTGLLG
jgi:hypothetical protein